MTNDKLVEVFQFYREELLKSGVHGHQLDDPTTPVGSIPLEVQLGHLVYMCETAIGFVQEGRTEKAFRWLGFIQGVLWKQGVFTLEGLKNHSRP